MEDAAIVALYWARDEQALAETAAKFGAYCRKIADNKRRFAGEIKTGRSPKNRRRALCPERH